MIFALLATVTVSACGQPKSLAEEFPGKWQDPTPDVMLALARKGIRGCGEFYQKVAADSATEYVVACSRMPDGSGRPAWVVYRVWPGIDEVMGPDLTAAWKLGGPPRPDPE